MSKSRPQVYLHQQASEALNGLQTSLEAEGIPMQATRQDIASALVLYTSPQQAAGMLTAFIREFRPGTTSE